MSIGQELILSLNKWIKVEELKVGDPIIGLHGVEGRVTNITRVSEPIMFLFSVNSLQISGDQLIYTNFGWSAIDTVLFYKKFGLPPALSTQILPLSETSEFILADNSRLPAKRYSPIQGHSECYSISTDIGSFTVFGGFVLASEGVAR